MKIPEVIAYRSISIPESQWKSRPVDEWLKRWLDDCDYHESLVYEAIIKFCEEIREAAPTPPAQDQADWEDVDRLVKTLAYIQGIIERGEGRKMHGDEFIGEFVLNYVKKLERPSQEDEPVGYISHSDIDFIKSAKVADVTVWQQCDHITPCPLYTCPSDGKLRKAAEDLFNVVEELFGDFGHLDFQEKMENLRAALEKR